MRRIAVLRTARVRVDTGRFERSPRAVFVVSSPAAVRHFVRRLPEAVLHSGRFYSAGAATSSALAALGCRNVVTAVPAGLEGIVRAVRRDRARTVHHPTSDVGQGRLSRLLGGSRVTVDEFVAYRTLPSRPLPPARRRDLAVATHLVASSPSALRHLRSLVPPERWEALRRECVLFAPGALTSRAARRLGFRTVHEVGSLAGGGFTPTWLERLSHA